MRSRLDQSEAIEEALENCVNMRRNRSHRLSENPNVDRHDVTITRKQILRFLESLDDDLSVMDLRQALEGGLPS